MAPRFRCARVISPMYVSGSSPSRFSLFRISARYSLSSVGNSLDGENSEPSVLYSSGFGIPLCLRDMHIESLAHASGPIPVDVLSIPNRCVVRELAFIFSRYNYSTSIKIAITYNTAIPFCIIL